MIVIVPVYFSHLKQQNQDLIKRTNRIVFWPGTELGSFMEKYSIVLLKTQDKLAWHYLSDDPIYPL
jgi:hypothetical protein